MIKKVLQAFTRKSVIPSMSSTPGGGWWNVVTEPFTGAWQCNVEWRRETVLAYHAVFACITLIASDISKLRIKYVGQDSNGIWNDLPLGAFAFLDRPNSYQNRIQFIESWMNSKLARGNTYALKERDKNGKVIALHVMHPDRTLPLVTEDGEVFYQLGQDNLSGLREGGVTVPASEIIHDRFNCLFHPLVGLSPLFACGLAAYQGLKIQENSARHFSNMSRPSGIITAPGAISTATAEALKVAWEANFSGENYGKTAVLGDDLKYVPISISAAESQMVEQLRLTAEIVCSTFHVPKYKVIGDAPSHNNIEALEQQYYSQCLQVLIEALELCLDQGLEVKPKTGFEVDLEGLLRMDTKTQTETLVAGVKGGIDTPNEARKARNKPPLPGGDTVYLQEQNFSLEALSRRDEREDPFARGSQTAPPATPPAQEEPDTVDMALQLSAMITKELEEIAHEG